MANPRSPVPKRAVLIVNPHAGRGRAGRDAARLEEVAAAAGWEVHRWTTEAPGHEVALGERAAVERWPVAIATGGDGTVHGVANGLLRHGPEHTVLAHVPIGSGNDFASTVGLGRRETPARMLERVLAGRVRRVDVGEVADRYFINSLGVGFGAEVVRRAKEIPRLRGPLLYFLAACRTFLGYEPQLLEVAARRYRAHGRPFMVEVAIGTTAGGGFAFTPDAVPDDGQFDVCVVGEVGPLTFIRAVPRVLRGTHGTLRAFTIFRASTVAFEAQAPLTVHLDGELTHLPTRDATVRVLPRRLPVLCARA